MKKIGIYLEWKTLFHKAFIDRVNQNEKGIIAKQLIDKVVQNKDGEYAVIIDRISQDSFNRAYQNVPLTGTNVINNPSGGVLMINFQ
jgi:hypothetical protein